MTDSRQNKTPPSITVTSEKGDVEAARELLQPKFTLAKEKTNSELGTRAGNFIRGLLPIFSWICDYDAECAVNDFIAGITLGLTIVPESIACALLAGLPAHYGLCSAFLGSFVYLFFGSIGKVIVGPTSLVALVSVQFTVGKPVEFAVVLTFLAGIVQLLMGGLQLGIQRMQENQRMQGMHEVPKDCNQVIAMICRTCVFKNPKKQKKQVCTTQSGISYLIVSGYAQINTISDMISFFPLSQKWILEQLFEESNKLVHFLYFIVYHLNTLVMDSSQNKTPLSTTFVSEKGEKETSSEPLKPRFVLRKSTKSAQARKIICGFLPILTWISNYDTECAINDFIAGITLGLTIIPESMACALLAGLPAHYGVCSAFLGSFIYLFFGLIDNVIVGPTALVAVVSVKYTMGKPIEFAVMLTFLAGIMQLITGSLRLGFLFEFISMPVIKAFSTATAILVIESQLKVMLGIKYLAAGFVESIKTLSFRLDESNLGDFLMGLSAIVFLIFFEFLGRLAERPNQTKVKKLIFKYLSFSRNTLIVFISAMVTLVWMKQLPEATTETTTTATSSVPYALSKTAMAGLPNFTFPAMKIVTPEKTYYFMDILAELNLGIIVIPIVGVLTNISIGKLTPKCRASANQELFTLGLCNVIGSTVQSMPTSGAFTRYAISSACGLKTPMANLYSGIIVLLALGFLSPYLNYIPEATLAAILMCAIVNLIDFKLPLRLWRESRRDFYIWCICFCACVMFGVEVGLLVGIIITVSYLLYLWARPDVTVKIDSIDDMQYISVTPGNGIYFPAINYLRGKILKACIQADFKIPVVINCKMISGLDYTAAQGISRLSTDLLQEGSGSLLILYHMNLNLQKLIDLTENLVFCDNKEKIREFLTQESLRNGFINLKAHIRASIDLGYKVDIE